MQGGCVAVGRSFFSRHIGRYSLHLRLEKLDSRNSEMLPGFTTVLTFRTSVSIRFPRRRHDGPRARMPCHWRWRAAVRSASRQPQPAASAAMSGGVLRKCRAVLRPVLLLVLDHRQPPPPEQGFALLRCSLECALIEGWRPGE